MTFNQDILYLIKKHQQSKDNQMDIDFLFNEVVADKFIRLFTDRLSEQELDWVQTHLVQEKYVLLYTTKNIKERDKARLLHLVTQQVRTDEDSDYFKKLSLLINFGQMILMLGTIYLVLSGVLHLFSSPINESNDVVRFFIPIVIIYCGFVLVDYVHNQMIKRQNLNTLFQVHLFKKKAYPSHYQIISIDDKEVWIVYSKNNHHNHQLANTIKITDPKSLEEFVQFFDTYKYLDKKTGYSPEKVMSWIYKE